LGCPKLEFDVFAFDPTQPREALFEAFNRVGVPGDDDPDLRHGLLGHRKVLRANPASLQANLSRR
jgi:hypothetical protein